MTDLGAIARDVLDSLHEGCQVIGFDGRYLYVNDTVAAQGKRRKEELLGRTMAECYPGIEDTPMYEVLRRCMNERVHQRLQNEFTFPDGSRGWFDLRFIPIPQGVCVLSLDVTADRRAQEDLARTQEQLRHAQKMEAIGRLAGGVAHDFNNLLSVVLTYTKLMLGDLLPDSPMRRDLEEVHRAGMRAAELTRQLLAFSNQQVIQPRVVDLNQVVAGMEHMVRRLLGADIEVTVLRAPDLGRVRIDPGQVEQIVMNLVVNARDAMPRGGKLTLQTNNVHLDAQYAADHHGVVPGLYAMLAVTDTGHGMDRETQARIFEPFFTTKERGKGTGLGLSTLFGIVKQNGGHVWVYSEVDRGTTFRVYLPRTDEVERTVSAQPPPLGGVGGVETILLVEDDEQVRAAARSTLRRLGYTVLEAAGAGDALLLSEQYSARIHLLLVDLVLPRMAGPDLARRLVATRPGMKVLFMSGYTSEAATQHGLLDSAFMFLQKPITPDSLSRATRQALGGLSD